MISFKHMIVRTRIAPSPTGEDIHIGNLYTALMNWAYAKQQDGKFIVRIEDTDQERLVKGSEERILSAFKNFGLNYDESCDVGGEFAPYRQSERLAIYQKYARELVEKDAAYYCFCSKEKLAEIREKEEKESKRQKHIAYCENDNAEQRIKNSEQFVIRLRVPEHKDVSFEDLIRGVITINTDQIDDQVLLKSDGFPTYHLGVVIDDHLMEISHVIRAEEWIPSTPKHVLLYQAFDWELPVFCHLPILRNPDKSKLSKRKNPVWASWYLEQGFLKEAILNFLALMGWSHPDGKEIFPIEEFIEKLDLKRISPVGPAFDLTKLEWLNGEYIRAMSDEELVKRLEEFKSEFKGNELLIKLVPLSKERMKTLKEFFELNDFMFNKPEYNKEVINKLKVEDLGKAFVEIIEKLEVMEKPWNSENFEQTFRQLAEELKIPVRDMFQLIRVAIAGKLISPPMFECIEILGEEETIQRIKEARNFYG